MGIDIEAARFLLARRHEGASFEHCATLGRQHYFLGHKETTGLLEEFGLRPENFPNLFPAMYPPYSEPFWEMLGAKKLVTIDASSFEGAIHVHDMNQPIPAEWQESYDVVCDIGTLEHVFNFPVAIGNCMKMVKRGGHLFLHSPANNFFGHGFYQFSPELFFRVLSPQNGFKITHCVAVEYGLRRRWFTVADPETVRERVTLINSNWVSLLVWAKRTEIVPMMRETPQQSDYAAAWSETVGPDQRTPNVKSESSSVRSLKRWLLETAPRVARLLDRLRYSRFNRDFSFSNRRSFTPVSKRR